MKTCDDTKSFMAQLESASSALVNAMGKVRETVQARSDRDLQQPTRAFLETSLALSRQSMGTLVLHPSGSSRLITT